jgi:hypothetical protein
VLFRGKNPRKTADRRRPTQRRARDAVSIAVSIAVTWWSENIYGEKIFMEGKYLWRENLYGVFIVVGHLSSEGRGAGITL